MTGRISSRVLPGRDWYNLKAVAEESSIENLPELYLLAHEYDTALRDTSDPEKQRRIRRILHELLASIARVQER